MSYQLAFWATDQPHDPQATFQRITDGDGTDDAGLKPLDVMAIERALISASPGATIDRRLEDGTSQTMLMRPDGVALDVSWSFFSVVCTCYGGDTDDLNTVIDVMLHHGLPLFDPQTGERFA